MIPSVGVRGARRLAAARALAAAAATVSLSVSLALIRGRGDLFSTARGSEDESEEQPTLTGSLSSSSSSSSSPPSPTERSASIEYHPAVEREAFDDARENSAPSTDISAQILTRSSVPGLSGSLDAGDVVEVYALTRQARLGGIPAGAAASSAAGGGVRKKRGRDREEEEIEGGGRGFGTDAGGGGGEDSFGVKVRKTALAFRYRPPSGNSASVTPFKAPFELTLEYGPQRVGSSQEMEAVLLVGGMVPTSSSSSLSSGGERGGEAGGGAGAGESLPSIPSGGKFATWENDAKVYYQPSISARDWENAYYLAPVTGAVLSKVLEYSAEYPIDHPRYQPFEVAALSDPEKGRDTERLVLRSSSSEDFIWSVLAELARMYVNVDPVLTPPRRAVRFYVRDPSDVVKMSSASLVDPIDPSRGNVANAAADFYERFYMCGDALMTGDYQAFEREPTAEPTATVAPTASFTGDEGETAELTVVYTLAPTTAPMDLEEGEEDEDNEGKEEDEDVKPMEKFIGSMTGIEMSVVPSSKLTSAPADLVEGGENGEDGDDGTDEGSQDGRIVRLLQWDLELGKPAADNDEVLANRRLKYHKRKKTGKNRTQKKEKYGIKDEPGGDGNLEIAAARGTVTALTEAPTIDIEKGDGELTMKTKKNSVGILGGSAEGKDGAKDDNNSGLSDKTSSEDGKVANRDDCIDENSSPLEDDDQPVSPVSSAAAASQAAKAASDAAGRAKEAAVSPADSEAATAAEAAAEAAQKAADATLSSAVRTASESLLSGDGGQMTGVLATCFADPKFGIQRTVRIPVELGVGSEKIGGDDDEGTNDTNTSLAPDLATNTHVYLYIDGANYYRLNLTAPFWDSTTSMVSVPQPDEALEGRGDLIDWILACSIVVGFLYGVLVMLHYVGIVSLDRRLRFKWFFKPKHPGSHDRRRGRRGRTQTSARRGGGYVRADDSPLSSFDSEDEEEASFGSFEEEEAVIQGMGRGRSHGFAMDAIPASMGGWSPSNGSPVITKRLMIAGKNLCLPLSPPSVTEASEEDLMITLSDCLEECDFVSPNRSEMVLGNDDSNGDFELTAIEPRKFVPSSTIMSNGQPVSVSGSNGGGNCGVNLDFVPSDLSGLGGRIGQIKMALSSSDDLSKAATNAAAAAAASASTIPNTTPKIGRTNHRRRRSRSPVLLPAELRMARDPDMVDMPGLRSTSRVAVPIGINTADAVMATASAPSLFPNIPISRSGETQKGGDPVDGTVARDIPMMQIV